MTLDAPEINATFEGKFGPLNQRLGLHICKVVNRSRVLQVGPVDSCGQVGDLDPSFVNSRNLSRVGQVRPADSCGQVRNIDPSGSK